MDAAPPSGASQGRWTTVTTWHRATLDGDIEMLQYSLRLGYCAPKDHKVAPEDRH